MKAKYPENSGIHLFRFSLKYLGQYLPKHPAKLQFGTMGSQNPTNFFLMIFHIILSKIFLGHSSLNLILKNLQPFENFVFFTNLHGPKRGHNSF